MLFLNGTVFVGKQAGSLHNEALMTRLYNLA